MKIKLISWLVVFLLLSSLVFFYLQSHGAKKMGYLTTMKVFDAFVLKKELENEYKKTQMVKQTYLDSLKLTIQHLSVNMKQTNEVADQINYYKKVYLLKEEQFNNENQKLFDQYNEQIWKQLNQYVEDYGKKYGYDYLLGASGQGAIMYANDKEDLTKEIIQYINDKYNGKKSN